MSGAGCFSRACWPWSISTVMVALREQTSRSCPDESSAGAVALALSGSYEIVLGDTTELVQLAETTFLTVT